MAEQNKWMERFNSFANIVEQVNSGINFIKDILDESETDCSLPQIPSKSEVSEMLKNKTEYDEHDVNALEIYEVIAEPFYTYTNHLQKYAIVSDEDLQTEEIMTESSPYVIEILRHLRFCVDSLKKTKYGSKNFEIAITIFDFINFLVCDENSLSEGYPTVEFFADVDELWEIVVGVIDDTDRKYNRDTFSDFLNLYYREILKMKHHLSELLTDDCPKRFRKKAMKKYAKFMRITSKFMSERLTAEMMLLYRNQR